MPRLPHSADYIHDERFDWWSEDSLRLLKARAVGDKIVTRLADFGVGEGHWSLALARVFDDLRGVAGVDREAEWVRRSAEKYAARAPHIAYEAIEADASATPLADDVFDIVTAQTLLMHSLAPEKIVAEMVRVAKPGGTVICVEPVNHLNWAQTLELVYFCAPAERARLFGVWARYVDVVRSRRGDQDIGLRLPTLLGRAGLRNIRTWSNDRVHLTPVGEFDIDFLAYELRRDDVAEALACAGVGADDIAFLQSLMRCVREEKPPALDYVLRAPINIVCVGTAP